MIPILTGFQRIAVGLQISFHLFANTECLNDKLVVKNTGERKRKRKKESKRHEQLPSRENQKLQF